MVVPSRASLTASPMNFSTVFLMGRARASSEFHVELGTRKPLQRSSCRYQAAFSPPKNLAPPHWLRGVGSPKPDGLSSRSNLIDRIVLVGQLLSAYINSTPLKVLCIAFMFCSRRDAG